MKKTLLFCFLSAFATAGFAQSYSVVEESVETVEAVADTTHVVTIADIIKMQERVTSQHSLASHFEKVWGYKSFFNISYITSASLNPKADYTLGYAPINDDKVPSFKANYGLAIQLGHRYNLLKNPLANIVNFNIDYTYIDLSMAHYNKEPGEYVYNSDNTWVEDGDNGRTYVRQYLPWGLSKFDINYGMNVGPSVTLAPFTSLNIPELDFLKLNLYYHIGYQVGILWLVNDKDADEAQPAASTYNNTDPIKVTWQHGLQQSIGFSLSWKTIGIGYEARFDNHSCKSIDTTTYGSNQYKFSGKNSRIYLQINY